MQCGQTHGLATFDLTHDDEAQSPLPMPAIAIVLLPK